MQIITAVAVAVVGSSGLWALILAIVQHKWKRQDEKRVTPEQIDTLIRQQEQLVHANKIILADRIHYLGQCYIYAGEITLSDKSTLHDMYEIYEQLDGKRDHCDVVIDAVDKLTIVEQYTSRNQNRNESEGK